MSAEPLTREERESFSQIPDGERYSMTFVRGLVSGYEATVQAAEARAERLREACALAVGLDLAGGPAKDRLRAALAADDEARA